MRPGDSWRRKSLLEAPYSFPFHQCLALPICKKSHGTGLLPLALLYQQLSRAHLVATTEPKSCHNLYDILPMAHPWAHRSWLPALPGVWSWDRSWLGRILPRHWINVALPLPQRLPTAYRHAFDLWKFPDFDCCRRKSSRLHISRVPTTTFIRFLCCTTFTPFPPTIFWRLQ